MFWPLFATLGILLEELLHHGRDDIAGRDGVDADVVLAPFRSQVATQLDNTSFRSVVCWANETLSIMLAQVRTEVTIISG